MSNKNNNVTSVRVPVGWLEDDLEESGVKKENSPEDFLSKIDPDKFKEAFEARYNATKDLLMKEVAKQYDLDPDNISPDATITDLKWSKMVQNPFTSSHELDEGVTKAFEKVLEATDPNTKIDQDKDPEPGDF